MVRMKVLQPSLPTILEPAGHSGTASPHGPSLMNCQRTSAFGPIVTGSPPLAADVITHVANNGFSDADDSSPESQPPSATIPPTSETVAATAHSGVIVWDCTDGPR